MKMSGQIYASTAFPHWIGGWVDLKIDLQAKEKKTRQGIES
jgi:hypothetical protein